MDEKSAQEILIPIESVEIFQNKALINRSGKITIKKGDNLFVVSDLPPNIQTNTLSVYKHNKRDSFIVKEFELKKVQKKNILTKQENKMSTELKALERELKERKHEMEIIQKRLDFFLSLSAKAQKETSENLLSKNINIKNVNDVIDFVSKNMRKDLEKKRKNEEDIENIQEKIQILESGISDINRDKLKWISILYIRIESNISIKSSVGIKYIVNNAYWRPYYEINYNTKTGIIETQCFAKIKQSTGENWNNAKIILATGSPLFDITLPEANPWVLRKYRSYPTGKKSAPQKYKMQAPATAAESPMQNMRNEEGELEAPPMPEELDEITKEELSLRLSFSGKFNIPGTGEEKKLLFKDITFKKSDTFYTVVPTKNSLAFLTAEFENDSGMILLSGEASLYLNGNHSGKSYITKNLREKEKLKFSFGTDENIKFSKTTIQSSTGERGLLGGKNILNYAYKITVENYKNKEITLYIEEPIPFSEDEDIVVDFFETGMKIHEKKERGIIIWKIQLNKNQKKKFIYKYNVTYPKDIHVENLSHH